MINAIIIDDETRSVETLRNLLAMHKDTVCIKGEAGNVKDGLLLIKNISPDLVFLDIEMPDGTGFDILKQIQHPSFDVIFTTAFDNYALQAFRFSAVGYLLKPISRDELAVAIENIVAKSGKRMSGGRANLKVLVENYENRNVQTRKLVLPDSTGFFIKPINEIVRLQGDRNYTRLFFSDKKSFLSSYTLSHFEELLSGLGFYRIFKSHLINLSHVQKYSKSDGGAVIMSDGAELQISADKRQEFKNLF